MPPPRPRALTFTTPAPASSRRFRPPRLARRSQWEHGTLGGYNGAGCRCPRCRAAIAEYRQARRAAGLRDDSPRELSPEPVKPLKPVPRPPALRGAARPGPFGRRRPTLGYVTKPEPAPASRFGAPEPAPADAEILALRRYLAGLGPSPTLLALRERVE
jgi:hypothetical protein